MKTSKATPVDNIKLHGDSVLTVAEIQVTEMEMNTISNAAKSKSPRYDILISKITNAPIIVVKISDKVLSNNSQLEIGDVLIPSPHDTPVNIINLDDIYDIENMVKNYQFDKNNQQSSIITTMAKTIPALKYTIHFYRIFNGAMIVASIKRD